MEPTCHILLRVKGSLLKWLCIIGSIGEFPSVKLQHDESNGSNIIENAAASHSSTNTFSKCKACFAASCSASFFLLKALGAEHHVILM